MLPIHTDCFVSAELDWRLQAIPQSTRSNAMMQLIWNWPKGGVGPCHCGPESSYGGPEGRNNSVLMLCGEPAPSAPCSPRSVRLLSPVRHARSAFSESSVPSFFLPEETGLTGLSGTLGLFGVLPSVGLSSASTKRGFSQILEKKTAPSLTCAKRDAAGENAPKSRSVS